MIEGKEEMPVLGKDGQMETAPEAKAGKPEKKVKRTIRTKRKKI